MEVLDSARYQALTAGAEPLKEMRQGVKVWRLLDGRILKLFRPRRRFSRTRLYPPNRRFARNARRLRRLEIGTVAVEQIFFNESNGCYGLLYAELPGRTLAAAMAAGPGRAVLVAALAQLLAKLHRAGVLFRSLHLDNVLVVNSGELALIDVEELTIRPGSLGVRGRLRNFSHLLRREQDRELLDGAVFAALFERYLEHTDLSAAAQLRLRRRLQDENLLPKSA